MVDANPVLYVIVRTDMPSMENGKAQAHSGHAVSAFERDCIIEPLRFGNDGYESVDPLVRQWYEMTKQGFGTQINLKVPWEDVIDIVQNITTESQSSFVRAKLVIDPEYPFIIPNKEILDLIDKSFHATEPRLFMSGAYGCTRKEYTAAYIFCDKNNNNVVDLLKAYPLHP